MIHGRDTLCYKRGGMGGEEISKVNEGVGRDKKGRGGREEGRGEGGKEKDTITYVVITNTSIDAYPVF
jgi:hypothetical protein